MCSPVWSPVCSSPRWGGPPVRYRRGGHAVTTTVLQAYRFALDPNPVQESALRSHCGGQRFAYNWGLARVTVTMDQRKAEQSSGLEREELTPRLSWSAYSLRTDWNRAKGVVAPWWGEGGVLVRSGESGDRVDELVGLDEGQTSGPQAGIFPAC